MAFRSVSFRGFRFFSSLFLNYERFICLPSRFWISRDSSSKLVRKIHIGTLLLISRNGIVKYFPCPCQYFLEWMRHFLLLLSFRGFRFFSSPFLNSEIFTKLFICQPAELDLPCLFELTIFPFEDVPSASYYSVPVTSTMRSSSFSYKVLPYTLLCIFFQTVRISKTYRKIQYFVTLSAVGFLFIHWRVLVFISSSFSPS